MSQQPLVKGGQGRRENEVSSAAWIASVAAALGVVAIVGSVVLAIMPGWRWALGTAVLCFVAFQLGRVTTPLASQDDHSNHHIDTRA